MHGATMKIIKHYNLLYIKFITYMKSLHASAP